MHLEKRSGLREPIKVVLVEDDRRWTEAVEATISTDGRYVIEGAYTTASDALTHSSFDGRLWLIDLGLPGGMSGLELIGHVASRGGRVMVMTVFEDETRVVAAIQAGADGYLLKGSGDLMEALDSVVTGSAPISPRVAIHVLKMLRRGDRSLPSGNGGLSPREMETLQALAHGDSYREVALRLNVSHHTIGDHVKSIYKKLKVNSKTEAIHQALKRGILSLDEV